MKSIPLNDKPASEKSFKSVDVDRDEPDNFRKIFLGGLSPVLTEDSLRSFYRQFGEIIDVKILRDRSNDHPRGFGFITYVDSSSVDKAQAARPHVVEGKPVDSKRVLARGDAPKPTTSSSGRKIFIGGLKDVHDEDALTEYFKQFGNVYNVKVIVDQDTGRKRGFAYVEFEDYDSADKAVLHKNHTIKYLSVDVKKSNYKVKESKRVEKEVQNGGENSYPAGGPPPAAGSYPQGPYPPAPYPPPYGYPPHGSWGAPPAPYPAAYDGQPPAYAGQPPASAGQPPSYAGQPPAYAGQPPAYAGQPPAYAGQPPANAGQPPANAGQPPANAGQPPANAGQPPAYAGQPPAYAGQPPAYAGQPSAYAGQPPAYAGQPSAYAGQPPAYAGQPSAYAGQPPAWNGWGYSAPPAGGAPPTNPPHPTYNDNYQQSYNGGPQKGGRLQNYRNTPYGS